MWESKEQTIDLNYNADELWFTGVYGQAVNKPAEIRKWQENTKFFKLLDKSYPRSKADRILQDLSLIALTYSKQAVQQRLTFKPNPKGENSAPVVFQYDKDGDLLTLALELRQVPSLPPEDGPTPKKTPASKAFKTPRGDDEDDLQDEVSSTFEVETRAERNFRQQKEAIESWLTSDPPKITDSDKYPLELYCQLTDDELIYVQELQRVYDEARCYFVQWVLGKETKELVNSARISAIQQGKKFTWVHVRLEILTSLTDVTLTARFLALSSLKRKTGSTAKLWISQVMYDSARPPRRS